MSGSLKDATFLVVDDSATIRKLIGYVIRTKLGSDRVIMASDGKEALRHLKDTRIDIIISDWNMEGVDGEELLYWVRNDESYRDIPFIMVTTNAHKDYVITALQLGVTQYLSKPFTPAQLEQKVRASWNAAGKRRAERHAALPAHQAVLELGDGSHPVELVDLSATGVLLRVENHDAVRLNSMYGLTMSFQEAGGGHWNIPAIQGRAVRMEVDEDSDDACLLALEFRPESIGPEAKDPFNELLQWLSQRTPEMIGS